MLSTSNLNEFFNNIMNGITDGQLTFTNEIDHIATVAIPINNPKFPFGDVAFWLIAILAAIACFIPFVGPEAAVAIAGGVSAFSAAGIQQASYTWEPSDTIGVDQVLTSIQNLRNSTAIFGTKARDGIETDYLHGGAYEVNTLLPGRSSIGQFYAAQLTGRAVNSQWRSQKVWVTRMLTDNALDISGPNQTKYYSTEEKAVYYAYRYNEDGTLRGHLDELWGLDELSYDAYQIHGSDVTKSSARAWKLGKFNFTNEMALKAIQDSVASNGNSTPFKDGPGWIGTFTLPVYDMGTNSWNSQYKDKFSHYGTGYKDTKDFVKAANLVGYQTLLRACKVQLASTNIKFEEVDYGFKWKKSFPKWWAEANGKSRAGAVIGFILAFPATLIYFGVKGVI